jgi:F0F1-type ATP synthase membrane subunit c/vacuolar-type H+-ATPase subunit K
MFVILKTRVYDPQIIAANAGAFFSIGLAAGLGELFSAWMQGVIGASGIRAMSESEGAPFAFTLIGMGIAETVGIFSFVLMFLMMPAAA